MNPKNFLMWVGWILLVVGIVGFLVPNLLDPVLVFDQTENWAHTVLGIVALAAAYWSKDANTQKWLAVIYGALALIVGLWGFFNPEFLGAMLENPADNLIHLVIGVWGLWAGLKGNA